jgi:hypothetical protein
MRKRTMFDSGQKWAGFVWSGQISAFPGHTGSAFRTSASLPPKARRAYNVKGADASRMIRITASRLGRAIGGVGERRTAGSQASRTAASTWTTLRGQQRRVLGQRRADGDLGGSGDGDADHGAGLRRCSSPPRTRASRTGSWRTAGSSPTPARMANGSRGPTMGSTAMRRRLRCGWSRGGDGAPRLQSRSANSLSAGIDQCLAISAQVIVPILLENSAR